MVRTGQATFPERQRLETRFGDLAPINSGLRVHESGSHSIPGSRVEVGCTKGFRSWETLTSEPHRSCVRGPVSRITRKEARAWAR